MLNLSNLQRPAFRGRRGFGRRVVFWVKGGVWYGICTVLVVYRLTLLRRVTFVAVTGSAGKTSTKELTHAVLSRKYRGRRSFETLNTGKAALRTLMGVMPWHDFMVQEISVVDVTERPNMDRMLSVFMPSIGLVTSIGRDHLDAFENQAALAAEKGKLVAALPSDGTAILNGDDPLVAEMARRSQARVLAFGYAASAGVRAEALSCAWPDRLSFDVVWQDERHRLQTRLIGSNMVPACLAALATGLTMGVPLSEGITALSRVEPVEMRMSPVERPDGVTFIRDDIKASPASVEAALSFMADATAKRKVMVLGTLSDYHDSPEQVYPRLLRRALAVADLVVAVGRWAHKAFPVQRNDERGRHLFIYPALSAAQSDLAGLFQAGDLVLVKANHRLDKTALLLDVPALSPDQAPLGQQVHDPSLFHQGDKKKLAIEAVFGLGNPGGAFESSPHNAGAMTLDRVVADLGLAWQDTPDGLVARYSQNGRDVCLIKPKTPMNRSGHAIKAWQARLGFAPSRCLLIFDDVLLAPGRKRFRFKGGDGGHQGCRSVVSALGTTFFPRIRVGVGGPADGEDIADYVLRPMTGERRTEVDKGCGLAAEEIIGILRPPLRSEKEKDRSPTLHSGEARPKD